MYIRTYIPTCMCACIGLFAEIQRPVKLGTFRDGRYLKHRTEWCCGLPRRGPLKVQAKTCPYRASNISDVFHRQKGFLISNFAIVSDL